MNSIKRNLLWVAPVGAMALTLAVLFAAGLLNIGAPQATAIASGQSTPATLEAPEQPVLQAQAAAVSEPQSLDSEQILSALQRATRGADTAEVTRNEPLAILEAAAPASPAPAVETPSVKSTSAAAFFADAQANLANNAACGDDLKALAAQTRIYFPAGGLTAEATGLIQARVLGQIAGRCPAFTLAVRGHSDPSGDPQVNLALSKKRAEAVIARLTSAGIDTSTFVAVGVGDKEPSRVTGPREAAYYDRRVEFEVIENRQTASLGGFKPTLGAPVSDCARALENKVAQTRLFYSARSITASPGDLEVLQSIAAQVDQCPGTRLRIVGHHSDDIADRESMETGRLRALILMASMIEAGHDSEKLIIGAPSYSVAVAGQPSMPRSRIDFQIITD